MATLNETTSLRVIIAKQELEKFLEEQKKLKGRCSKIDNYHTKRILELRNIID